MNPSVKRICGCPTRCPAAKVQRSGGSKSSWSPLIRSGPALSLPQGPAGVERFLGHSREAAIRRGRGRAFLAILWGPGGEGLSTDPHIRATLPTAVSGNLFSPLPRPSVYAWGSGTETTLLRPSFPHSGALRVQHPEEMPLKGPKEKGKESLSLRPSREQLG
jgi:hypothetical protein